MQYLPSSVRSSRNAGLGLSSHLCSSQHQNIAPNNSPSVPSTRTLQEEQEDGAACGPSLAECQHLDLTSTSSHPTRTFHPPASFWDTAPPAQGHCLLVPSLCTQTPPAPHHLLEVLNGAGAALGTMPMAPGEISLNLESGTTHYPTQQRRLLPRRLPFPSTCIKMKGQIN